MGFEGSDGRTNVILNSSLVLLAGVLLPLQFYRVQASRLLYTLPRQR
jgi:hypothetical protein